MTDASQRIEQLKNLTALNSFGVAAQSRAFAKVETVEDLQIAGDFARRHDLPVMILGGGSNVLFLGNYPGLILHPSGSRIRLAHRDQDWAWVTADAGVPWHQLVMWCLDNKCYGIENLALIPGAVGAAPIQNIGAYGVELKDWFFELEAWDLDRQTLVKMNQTACQFAYRDSIFKGPLRDRLVILSVTLRLSRQMTCNLSYTGVAEELDTGDGHLNSTPPAIAEAVSRLRRRKLPDSALLGNAGSFFKNPRISHDRYLELRSRYPELPGFSEANSAMVKVPAAWMLEDCGFKGLREGQVGAYGQQPLVIVNYGGATGAQILGFAQKMQAAVAARFGIVLESEVRIVGDIAGR